MSLLSSLSFIQPFVSEHEWSQAFVLFSEGIFKLRCWVGLAFGHLSNRKFPLIWSDKMACDLNHASEPAVGHCRNFVDMVIVGRGYFH